MYLLPCLDVLDDFDKITSIESEGFRSSIADTCEFHPIVFYFGFGSVDETSK